MTQTQNQQSNKEETPVAVALQGTGMTGIIEHKKSLAEQISAFRSRLMAAIYFYQNPQAPHEVHPTVKEMVLDGEPDKGEVKTQVNILPDRRYVEIVQTLGDASVLGAETILGAILRDNADLDAVSRTLAQAQTPENGNATILVAPRNRQYANWLYRKGFGTARKIRFTGSSHAQLCRLVGTEENPMLIASPICSSKVMITTADAKACDGTKPWKLLIDFNEYGADGKTIKNKAEVLMLAVPSRKGNVMVTYRLGGYNGKLLKQVINPLAATDDDVCIGTAHETSGLVARDDKNQLVLFGDKNGNYANTIEDVTIQFRTSLQGEAKPEAMAKS